MSPKLSDRSTRQQWTASGSRDANTRARERIGVLLKSHVPEPLEPDVRKRVDCLIKEYSRSYGVCELERTDQ